MGATFFSMSCTQTCTFVQRMLGAYQLALERRVAW
jgi:hypothetical protein